MFVSPVLDPEAFAVNQLERNVGMCISSVSSDPNVSQENSRGGVLSVSDCSPIRHGFFHSCHFL